MKTYNIPGSLTAGLKKILLCSTLLLSVNACKDDVLTEVPLAFLNPDVVLVNKAGFDTYLASMQAVLRSAYFENDDYGYGSNVWDFQVGTDVGMNGDPGINTYVDYRTWVTPTAGQVNHHWEWAYLKVIPRANTLIEYAAKPGAVWKDEAEKNAAVGEARFLRAYAYNILANLYGGVPIVDQVATGPKLDFKRSTRAEVLAFVLKDLEFAAQWLPKSTTQDGRVVKAAADHLLAEVYNNVGQYDKAIASASAVINDGQYQLMTSRFGKYTAQPGDVFSDLFKDNNQNRTTSGNKETIWALQFEFQTPGGIPKAGGGNGMLRAWGPRYFAIKDPDGKTAMAVSDSLGRPVGWFRPTNYFNYTIWNDRADIRNSAFNIRRDFYYNEKSSKYFGQKVNPRTAKDLDTMYWYYPYIRKIEGEALAGATYGRTFKEFYMMRLAETYLLRAEAYLLKGDLQKAADDINVVRNRAKAKPITANEVTLDYLLDERARELMLEELRRLTLNRMNKLVERVKKYNPRSGGTIQPYHAFFPIPQKFIDANIEIKVDQNQGY
ncbi:RagB/SusD family nutrient uptake outer membrane protein [Fibrella aquatica]|uniref:RagB/SusD family nutrient uptake outer membrane protein n=1 Tax=Fibrella aquatica TaxID=3242487 RepID=UPI003522AD03